MNQTRPTNEAIARLRKALRDPDVGKRRWAIVTLVKHDAAPIHRSANGDNASRAEARDRIPTADLEVLSTLLSHLPNEPDIDNLLIIVRHLGARGYRPSREPLERLLEAKPDAPRLRQEIQSALESISDESSLRQSGHGSSERSQT